MTKPRLITIVVGVLAPLVLAPGRAAATAYVVAPTGNDAAAGSAAAPWRTLQKAATKVMAGDTVTVRDGTYAGFACDGRSGTAAARIVFQSENKGGAKITSAGAGADPQDFVQLMSCSYVTVDGFEVSGAPRSGIAILGNAEDGSDARDVLIQNNHSHDNGGPVAHGRHDGIFSGFALNLTIQDNEVHDNSEHGIYVSNAADNPIIRRNQVYDVGVNCIQINADLSTGGDGLISGWLIDGNVVHGCGSAGFNLDGAIHGVLQNNLVYDSHLGGVTLFMGDGAEASHDNLIVNNTIYNPGGSRSALQLADGANNNVVFNNILYAKATGLEIQTVTGLMHDYNFISSYSGGAAAMHEATADPALLFVDVAARNLALAARSPALGSGVATLDGRAAPGIDIDGKARPVGIAPDRGCFEGTAGGGTGPIIIGTGGHGGAADAGAPLADGGATVAGTGGASGTGAAPGTGGRAGAGPVPGTGGATGAAPGAVTGTGGVMGGGASASDSEFAACGCRAAGAGMPGGWVALGAAALACALRRRRRS